MKNTYILSILLLVFGSVAHSQIKGTILMDSLALPGAEFELLLTGTHVMSDFDGEFTLPIKSEIKRDDLLITYVDLKVIIKNIDLSTGELNMGQIHMPFFKSIEIEEYEKLSKLDKENCIGIYCWGNLLGYYDEAQLENNSLTLNCNQAIVDYTYDSKVKTITIDWSVIKNCN